MIGPHEAEIIEASDVPIYTFWNMVTQLDEPGLWPNGRYYYSSRGKTVTSSYVTYQSKQNPLPTLGIPGDTWITENCVFLKDTYAAWIPWVVRQTYRCPYDDHRVLGWARSCQFKWLRPSSLITERRRWDGKGPSECFHFSLYAMPK